MAKKEETPRYRDNPWGKPETGGPNPKTGEKVVTRRDGNHRGSGNEPVTRTGSGKGLKSRQRGTQEGSGGTLKGGKVVKQKYPRAAQKSGAGSNLGRGTGQKKPERGHVRLRGWGESVVMNVGKLSSGRIGGRQNMG